MFAQEDARATPWIVLSFIVPAYNEELELPATIEAICLAAKNRQYEVIVADDASTDGTAKVARDAGAKVVSINRRQIAAARNAGANAASGDILLFVDADTRINEKHLSGAIAALQDGYAGGGAASLSAEQFLCGHAFSSRRSARFISRSISPPVHFCSPLAKISKKSAGSTRHCLSEKKFISVSRSESLAVSRSCVNRS